MLLKPLTLAAGLLAVPATQAFLLPPEVSDADVQVANTIESIGSQIAQTQVVDVECPGCPVLLTGRRGKNIQVNIDRPSHLELTFSVDHQPDHDRLLVNGFALYPAGDMLSTNLLSAPQIVDREDKEKRHRPEHDHHDDREHRRRPHRFTPQPQKLGFGLQVGTSQKDAAGQFELVELELQIIAVGVAFIDGIPDVKVKLVKDAEGRLLMSQIEKGEPKHMLDRPGSGAGEECTTVMCKWLAFARAKLEKLKSLKGFKNCHGAKGGMKPPVSGDAPHHHPHPHHPAADNWRAPYHEHRWGKLLKHMASHILLPVLIGIVAGVSVSLIGMAVGTVIVSLWRMLFRRRTSSSGSGSGHRRRHSHHHKAARKEAAFEEEKSGLMAYQDAPPSYEEQEEEVVKTAQV